MNRYCCGMCTLALIWVLLSCDKDDWRYPSVKQEYVTAFSDESGKIKSVQTDDGVTCPVLEDLTSFHMKSDSAMRIVTNYENLITDKGISGVKIYALLKAVSPVPLKAHEFQGGVKTESAEVQSIWLGYNYLNILLSVKQPGTHRFGFVEKSVSVDEGNQCVTVNLMLYHATTDSALVYSRRAYLSVPLKQYLADNVKNIVLLFNLYTESGDLRTYTVKGVIKKS